jgi:hypothetical protein
LNIEGKTDSAAGVRLGKLLARYVDRIFLLDGRAEYTVKRCKGRNTVLWRLERKAAERES